MSFNLPIILDVIVIVLLVPTIVYAVILNNRLAFLRKNREELARMIAAFNEATARAETGIPRLRKATEEAAKSIQEKVDRAQMLRDDLAFMVERAEATATRVEGAVRQGRDHGKPGLKPASTSAASSVSAAADSLPPIPNDIESLAAAAERAETAAAALTGLTAPTAPLTAADRAATGPEPRLASRPQRGQPLGAALGGGASSAVDSLGDDERSEAERELLRALRSVR